MKLTTYEIIAIVKWIGLFIAIIYSVIETIKNRNKKNAIKMDQSLIAQIANIMNEAEKLYLEKNSGEAKKKYVKEKMQLYCMKNKIKYDDKKTEEYIEEMLNAPKKALYKGE